MSSSTDSCAITFENMVGAFAELNSVLAVFELAIDDAARLATAPGSWQ